MALQFLDRKEELGRLNQLARSRPGGLAVVFGRRRLGKTRLLLEWTRKHKGLYITADLSSPDVQRRVVAAAIAERFPGFGDAAYPDWSSLLTSLSREAKQVKWRGPLVIDELPYLVQASPELPSVLQRWIDHEAAAAKLVVAIAGSSQRMMQGIVLDAGAPLYGRASVSLQIGPLPAVCLKEVFKGSSTAGLIEHYAAWGTVARYWELAAGASGDVETRIDHLLLDSLGPLHGEPDRLLLEDIPPATEVRPVLDAIGMGAHRLSEIAGRVGHPATSLSRPLKRLLEMGLLRRETPFGESSRKSKVSLYRIADPLLRLWFRVVSPNQAFLAASSSRGRIALLRRYHDGLRGEAFEELCRAQLPHAAKRILPECKAGLGPAQRWWRGNAPEWDIVTSSLDEDVLILGLAHYSLRPIEAAKLYRLAQDLRERPAPDLPGRYRTARQVRALFVPAISRRVAIPKDVRLITAADLLS